MKSLKSHLKTYCRWPAGLQTRLAPITGKTASTGVAEFFPDFGATIDAAFENAAIHTTHYPEEIAFAPFVAAVEKAGRQIDDVWLAAYSVTPEAIAASRLYDRVMDE